MKTWLFVLVLAGALGGALLARRRRRRRMDRLTAQIEHFLLYMREPLEESLSEGSAINLRNQISRLEQSLLLQREAARRQEKQTIRFVENMAHQMNNALTALQIQLDMLELYAQDGAPDPLRKSQACMKRLADEMDTILKSSQLAEGKISMAFEAVDLPEELAACRERLGAVAEARGVSVKLEGPERLFLSADPFWLSQALENVIKNAVEHTAPHSEVTVAYADEGRKIRVQVMDQGAGIPPDELGRLFERYHRGETNKAGYGIGLSMAKDVIDRHHGTISVRNREERGAVFEIVLPVLEGALPYGPDRTEENA